MLSELQLPNLPLLQNQRLSYFYPRMENGATLMREEEVLFDLNVGPRLAPSTWAGFVLCSKTRESNPRKSLLTGHTPPVLQRPSSHPLNWLFVPALFPPSLRTAGSKAIPGELWPQTGLLCSLLTFPCYQRKKIDGGCYLLKAH